jgi:20S proteasome alpha/beta subunit
MMTLIIGSRGIDGAFLSADRRRLAKHEKGPDVSKLFKLSCGVVLAGAGDDAVLNEARILVDHRVEELQAQASASTLLEVVEVTASVVNELVSRYQGMVEEPFGFVLAGLENLDSGTAKIYTIFGGGFSEVPWVCLGSGSSYARPLTELLVAKGDLSIDEAAKTMPAIFTLVSNVQTTVGGGVDICRITDGQGISNITHSNEIDLSQVRTAFLGAVGIKGEISKC